MKIFNVFFLTGIILLSNSVLGQVNKENEDLFKEKFYQADEFLEDNNYPAALNILNDLATKQNEQYVHHHKYNHQLLLKI